MPGISLLRKLVKETLAGKDPAVLEVLAEHISRVWSMMGNHVCEVIVVWHRESALLCCVFGLLEFVLASDQKTVLAGPGFYGDWCKWHKEANSMYSLFKWYLADPVLFISNTQGPQVGRGLQDAKPL